MAARRKTLPSMRESLDLKRPRLHRVSVSTLLRSTAPAFDIVSICTSALRPTAGGTAPAKRTRHTSHAWKGTVSLPRRETGLSSAEPESSGTRDAASASSAPSVTRSRPAMPSGAPAKRFVSKAAVGHEKKLICGGGRRTHASQRAWQRAPRASLAAGGRANDRASLSVSNSARRVGAGHQVGQHAVGVVDGVNRLGTRQVRVVAREADDRVCDRRPDALVRKVDGVAREQLERAIEAHAREAVGTAAVERGEDHVVPALDGDIGYAHARAIEEVERDGRLDGGPSQRRIILAVGDVHARGRAEPERHRLRRQEREAARTEHVKVGVVEVVVTARNVQGAHAAGDGRCHVALERGRGGVGRNHRRADRGVSKEGRAEWWKAGPPLCTK
eukprot:7385905-Prymnesium_polylepis.1